MYQPLCMKTDRDIHSYSAIVDQPPGQKVHRANVETGLVDHIDQPLRSQMDVRDHTYLEILNPLPAEQIVHGEQGYIPMTFQCLNQEEPNARAVASEDAYITRIGQSASQAEHGANFGIEGTEYTYNVATEKTLDLTDHHQTIDSGAGERLDVRDHAYLEILNILPTEQIELSKHGYIPMTSQAPNQEERNASAETSEYSYISTNGQSSSCAQQGSNSETEGNEYAYITTIGEPSIEAEPHGMADSGAGEYSYITHVSYPVDQANQRQQTKNTGCKTYIARVVLLLGVVIVVIGVTLGLWHFLGRDMTEIPNESTTSNTGLTTDIPTVSWDADHATKSSQSTFEFVVPKSYFTASPVRLMIYSSQTGYLQVKGIGFNKNKTLKEGENIIKLPRAVLKLLYDTSDKQNKPLRIISCVPIYLSVAKFNIGYQDVSYIIPKRYLSTQYIVPTFTVWQSLLDRSQIGITSLDTPSQVNITVRTTNSNVFINGKKYEDGEVIKLNLAPYESLQISHVHDLSGTTITASAPIAVMAGNLCGKVLPSAIHCNDFIENILPVDQQDTEFIIPIILNRPANVVRLYSYYQNNVSIYSNNSVINKVIEPEGWDQFLHNNVSYIMATSNLLVIIYPSQTYKYSSFMMTIHGKKQYKSEYVFVVPRRINDDDTTYLSFSLYGNETAGFEMDGKPLIVSSVFTTTIEGKMISSFVNEVAPGAHKVINTDKHSFGLWIYGNVRYSGYGLPAGIYFN